MAADPTEFTVSRWHCTGWPGRCKKGHMTLAKARTCQNRGGRKRFRVDHFARASHWLISKSFAATGRHFGVSGGRIEASVRKMRHLVNMHFRKLYGVGTNEWHQSLTGSMSDDDCIKLAVALAKLE